MREVMKNFVKDRNEAFASKDEKRILAYCKKYDIPVPKDKDIFWAGVHKTVCSLYMSDCDLITLQSYTESCDWLKDHGYNLSINGR